MSLMFRIASSTPILLTTLCLIAIIHRIFISPLLLMHHYQNQGIKGSRFIPLVGDLPYISRMRSNHIPFNEWFKFWDESCGRVSFFFMGPDMRLRLGDPELARGVLITNAASFNKTPLMRNTMGRLLGNGLLLSEGIEHRTHRALVSPAFTYNRMRAFAPVIHSAAKRGISALINAGKDGTIPVDFHAHAAGLTLWIIAVAAFGVELPGLLPATEGTTTSSTDSASFAVTDNDAKGVYDSISFLLSSFVKAVSSLSAFLPVWIQRRMPTQFAIRIRNEITNLRLLVGKIISTRRNVRESTSSANEEKGFLIDQLLDSGLSNESILDESLTFVMAGHETTAQALSFALYLLAKHPEIRSALINEIEKAIPLSNDFTPSTENYSCERMPLLNGVLYETLRLFPPAPLVARIAITDVLLTSSSLPPSPPLHILKGTAVVIPIASIHRDATLWPNPDDFLPERWAEGPTKNLLHPLAFLAFSAGTRNCVGSQFALLEARIILAELVRAADWKLDDTYIHAPEMAVTLRPALGMPIRVWGRK